VSCGSKCGSRLGTRLGISVPLRISVGRQWSKTVIQEWDSDDWGHAFMRSRLDRSVVRRRWEHEYVERRSELGQLGMHDIRVQLSLVILSMADPDEAQYILYTVTGPLPLFRASSMSSARRLKNIQNVFATSSEIIDTLTLGDMSYQVPVSRPPSRLSHLSPLDPNDAHTREHLYFLLQKFVLGQDVYLLAQPGPYARRLALTFCRCVRAQ
jgi:hypothetical protein